MTAPDYFTWAGDDDNDPRRPSTDDLGGDEKEDNAAYPPDPVTMPTAAGWNQQVQQIAALAKMASACKLDVRYTAGAPAIYAAVTPNPDITVATFTVTDSGTGVVLIEWPANTFPPERIRPNGLTIHSADATAKTGHVERTANGIRVRLFAVSTAADLDFTVCLD